MPPEPRRSEKQEQARSGLPQECEQLRKLSYAEGRSFRHVCRVYRPLHPGCTGRAKFSRVIIPCMENIEPVKPYRVVRDDFGQIQSSDAVAHISQPANSRSKGREFNQTSVETIIHIAFAHQLLRQSPEKGPWLFNASLYGVDESISQPPIRCDERATSYSGYRRMASKWMATISKVQLWQGAGRLFRPAFDRIIQKRSHTHELCCGCETV